MAKEVIPCKFEKAIQVKIEGPVHEKIAKRVGKSLKRSLNEVDLNKRKVLITVISYKMDPTGYAEIGDFMSSCEKRGAKTYLYIDAAKSKPYRKTVQDYLL